MNEPQVDKLIARLGLWTTSIEETKKLLKLHRRSMDAFINRKDIKERTTQWFEDRQNYIDSQLKLKTGLEKESFEAWNKFGFVIIIAKKEFDENNPRIYPDSGDTIFMGSACGELAIVYFCQIYFG